MAVKLRLKRMGSKGNPFYRIVAADSRAKRDGKFIELVGTYNPVADPALVKIDSDKVLAWLGKGAQPTDTVRCLLSDAGIMKKFHESKSAKKTTTKKETTKKTPAKKETVKKTTTKTTTKKATTKKEGK